MQYFPLFMDLKDKPVLVIGGGEVASRKVEALVKAGADVLIVSPQVSETLQTLVSEEQCRWSASCYDSSVMDTYPFVQVWATTDSNELNHQIHADAKQRNLLINVVDDQPYCDFITPSMLNRGRIQIAVSSGGASPVLIRNLRETLESVLPQNLALLADFGASKRDSIKEALPTVDLRRKFWERFFADSEVKLADNNRVLEVRYQELISKPTYESCEENWIIIEKDVELLPLKALRFMQQAEIVLHSDHDCLAYLELCRRDAERAQYRTKADLVKLLNEHRKENKRIIVLIHPTLRYLYQQCSQAASLFLHGHIDKH
ncbi:NAD(P)-dependent oxidoreductase [Vibrio viridaestus]|uniref:precorrin-2 dehydrogenase n=1 Tax=Vibrio viridaestus TaxID=2487322 RepID=A0A3N9TJ11_9VIBR|nr:NAD(P)-dependent oxidoreductase [Vibrio viridaestus]RQW63545.1 siroheme synthase [Vibrio viridaestus]